MPVEPSVRNIAAFHFGDCNKLDPVRSLDEALKKIPADRLKETLLVLPEAFNVRNGYYKTPQDEKSGTDGHLSDSRPHRVTM